MKKVVSSLSTQKASWRGPTGLLRVVHFHQRPGADPNPRTIGRGEECVELVTGGRGWVEHDGDWREVRTGDLVWHGPGLKTIGRSDWNDPYRCLAVDFRVRTAGGRGLPRFSFWPDAAAVKRLAEEAPRLFFDPGFDRTALMHYLHATLFFRLRLHERSSRERLLPEPLRAVLEAMDADYAGRPTLPGLARRAGWSVPHLHAVFRQHLGTTPHQWLLGRRLRAAQERLAGTRDSVKEIAHACGFHDPAAFVHAFKKHHGQTPGRFRAKYLAG